MKIGPDDGGGRPLGPEYSNRQDEILDSQNADCQSNDSVDISCSADEMAELNDAVMRAEQSLSIAAAGNYQESKSEAIREERVSQAKERLEKEYYLSPRIKDEIARRLTDEFLK